MENDYIAHIDIKNILTSLTDVFMKTGIRSIKALLGIECKIHDIWEVRTKTVCCSNVVMTMGSSNDNYQTLLIIGIEQKSLCKLLGKEDVSPKFALDVLGELGNTYCAILMDSKELTQYIGIVKQSIPMVYVNGQSYMPCILGIEGKLYFGNDDFILMRYAIQKK
ncbi:MAG: hypothetical protein HQK76_15320 [Desulfobacterales bacterium]|nr:hypothetical protein [Desulfobacterales bacterium]